MSEEQKPVEDTDSSNVVSLDNYLNDKNTSTSIEPYDNSGAPLIIVENNKEILRLDASGKLTIDPENTELAATKLVMCVQEMCTYVGSQNPFKDAHTFYLEEEKRRLENRVELLEDAMRRTAVHAIAYELAFQDLVDKNGGEVKGHFVSKENAMFAQAAVNHVAMNISREIALADIRPLADDVSSAREDNIEG